MGNIHPDLNETGGTGHYEVRSIEYVSPEAAGEAAGALSAYESDRGQREGRARGGKSRKE